ncbi:MAG: LUD domain-containing protein [Verrucomicrobia bacterium]|nr:LUD domain-containing protein [Cytophagales bacterium]
MSSRDEILQKISQNKPEFSALPEKFTFESDYKDLMTKFCEVLKSIGGSPVEVADYEELKSHFRNIFSDLTGIASPLPELADLTDFSLEINDPHDLEMLHVAILQGKLAVAENGAIWLTESEMVHRALPFICQHLVLVIENNTIISNMHQAYQRINISESAFGVFIAGPSKTADIEQSLVIGAHGARSLVVYIIKSAR